MLWSLEKIPKRRLNKVIKKGKLIYLE